jgi:hypothetical protein
MGCCAARRKKKLNTNDGDETQGGSGRATTLVKTRRPRDCQDERPVRGAMEGEEMKREGERNILVPKRQRKAFGQVGSAERVPRQPRPGPALCYVFG